MLRLFYDPRQSASGNESYSPSAGKPAAFVEAALARYPGLIAIDSDFAPLSRDEIALAHDRAHVDAVLDCEVPNGFDNRLASVAASLPWTTGSFVAAARAAARDGGAACSPTSGFHHAEFAASMGFCTFNGLAIAAILLRREGLASRVGIADFDAHYGNGTADIVDRLGLDHIVNHSLGRFIGGLAEPGAADRWLDGLEEELEGAFEGCDIIFYQAGADPHAEDPLGGYLGSEQLRRRDAAVFRYARRSGKPIAWNLAGGYQEPLSKVIELHLATVEECLAAFPDGSQSASGSSSTRPSSSP
jgi:acetoin utilization deacetylase AcuC-like enzyme